MVSSAESENFDSKLTKIEKKPLTYIQALQEYIQVELQQNTVLPRFW